MENAPSPLSPGASIHHKDVQSTFYKFAFVPVQYKHFFHPNQENQCQFPEKDIISHHMVSLKL